MNEPVANISPQGDSSPRLPTEAGGKTWWPSESLILKSVFWLLLAMTAAFAVFDYATIYQQTNVALPGNSERQEPMVMPPAKPSDHLRPYLPRAIPMRRNGKLPALPGYSKPPPADSVGKRMVFARGPNGTASALGRIEPGTAAAFADFIEGQGGEVKTLYLHSPGGSVQDAIAMSKLLRAKKIATRVPNDAYCASSCPIVLAGGPQRLVGARSWVGVHRIFATQDNPGTHAQGLADGQQATATIQQHLSDMGVDARAWIPAMQTPSNQIYIFTREQLKKYKIATNVDAR